MTLEIRAGVRVSATDLAGHLGCENGPVSFASLQTEAARHSISLRGLDVAPEALLPPGSIVLASGDPAGHFLTIASADRATTWLFDPRAGYVGHRSRALSGVLSGPALVPCEPSTLPMQQRLRRSGLVRRRFQSELLTVATSPGSSKSSSAWSALENLARAEPAVAARATFVMAGLREWRSVRRFATVLDWLLTRLRENVENSDESMPGLHR